VCVCVCVCVCMCVCVCVCVCVCLCVCMCVCLCVCVRVCVCTVPVHSFTNLQIFTKLCIDLYNAVSCQFNVTPLHFPTAENSRREIVLSWRTGESYVDSRRASLKSNKF